MNSPRWFSAGWAPWMGMLLVLILHAASTYAAPQVAGDEKWSPAFMQGTDDSIHAIASSGTDLYVGGDFVIAGGVAANYVARYNLAERKWYSLGSGVEFGRVYAIAVRGTKVYVGGYFYSVGGVSTNSLAVWDTTTQTWSQVGGAGMSHSVYSPEVRALAFDGSGNLYVGGQFDHVGALSAMNVAKWNGSSWSALGSGVGSTNDEVYALAASGSDVYAGGDFGTSIAHWNGSAWSGLGSGTLNSFYKNVNAIAISGNLVYAGGEFDSMTDATNGAVSANNIAQWNSSTNTWAALGSGASNGTGIDVQALVMMGGNLYVGGRFQTAGGVSAHRVAIWNGAWSLVKAPNDQTDGTDSNVYALAVNGTDLYVAGFLSMAGNWQDNHISRWDTVGQSWHSLAGGMDSIVRAVAVSGGDVYAGGYFRNAGGVTSNGIARWNASAGTWYPLGTGLSGCVDNLCLYPNVSAILVVGQDVYVGGNFLTAGGVTAHSIARWNMVDQQWHGLGHGVACSPSPCNADVFALAWDGSCVIVGGTFDTVNGTSLAAHNLAAWCGTSWANVVWNDGVNHLVVTNGPVYALAYEGTNNLLYVGGGFSSPVANLFVLDYGAGVAAVGDALNGAVRAIVATSKSEYIGGDFTSASGNSNSSHIARQAGVSPTWLPLGSGLNGSVQGLTLQGSKLVAAGAFTASGATGLGHAGIWDGSSWSGLGSGTDDNALAVAADSNSLYFGGTFQNAGGKPSMFFGRFVTAAATLDIDASVSTTKYDALTDGLLVLRYMFGLTGTPLTNGALGGTATRTDPAAVASYLDAIRTSLDIDGNGTTDALTDGLLVLRYLFGLTGNSLISGAVAPNATRTTAPDIQAYIQSLMP